MTASLSLVLALQAAQAPVDSLALAVYITILQTVHIKSTTRLVVISPVTAPGMGHVDDFDYQNGLKGLRDLPPGLQADFAQKRLLRLAVPVTKLPTSVPAVAFTDQEGAGLPRDDPERFWEAFYKRFPDSPGVVTFSPVGFSTDGSWAMVMVDTGCGPLCGDTTYYLLERADRSWRVVRRATVRRS